ncbi:MULTISPECIES: acyltransferase family protein [unclassified Arthrobacter]|uniref:acyltransferase family protein n=1 Tax=unclassified Arthrobacter TaxID=235627 RepID=UPI002157AC58|nr:MULTISPECIES: acyltransferase family protein [unclassified Arthrobacter]
MPDFNAVTVRGRHLAVPPNRARAADLDAIRLLGIVAVVVGHVWTSGPLTDALFAWHVPVFFILTGYLWKPGRTLRDEVTRRSKTLLVPYVAWLVVLSIAFASVEYLRSGSLPVEALRNAVYGGAFAVRPYSAFWFVPVLFFTAVLCRLLERFPAWVAWATAAVGLAVSVLAGSMMAKAPLGIALAVPCLVFVLVGRGLPEMVRRVRYKAAVGLGLVLAGVALTAGGAVQPLNMKDGDFGTVVLSVVNASAISLGLILVLSALYRVVSPAVNRLTVQLASTGLVVVLTHAFFLYLLNTPASGAIFDAMVALVVPFVLALLVTRSPLRRWLVG